MENRRSSEKEMCLIVEDNISTREYFCEVVQKALPHLEVRTAHDVQSARAWLTPLPNRKNFRITYFFIDLGLPDGSGVDLLRFIRRQMPESYSVVITMYDDDNFLFEALAAGAAGYLLKEESQDFLVEALKRLDAGEPPLSPSVARRLLHHFRDPLKTKVEQAHLSPRERETLYLLSQGMTVPEAAQSLKISPQTVSGYVKTIYRKLHVSNRVEAVQEALRQGLV